MDIGSNYGCHSIGVANHIKNENGSGKVYSFDIQKEITKIFKENVSMNSLDNYINIYEYGLGDKNENKDFVTPTNYDNNENPGGLSLLNQNLSDQYKKDSITVKRLDDLYIDNISLIKIDIEGYELEALEGGINTIRKNKPIILIEIWKKNIEKYKSWINTNFSFYNIENISNDDYLLRPV